MSREERSEIVNWMMKESKKGHFEHTIPEITRGVSRGREVVISILAKLETGKRPVIEHRTRAPRNRGSKKNPVPYYYLKAVRDLCTEEFEGR